MPEVMVGDGEGQSSVDDRFEAFVTHRGRRLRQALVSSFGPEIGEDATAEALAYGWSNRERVVDMANPTGYLFTVGRNWARRSRPRAARKHVIEAVQRIPDVEPALAPALARLTDRQRAVVLLMDGYSCTAPEVAEVLGISESAVRTHHTRALARLREALGVIADG